MAVGQASAFCITRILASTLYCLARHDAPAPQQLPQSRCFAIIKAGPITNVKALASLVIGMIVRKSKQKSKPRGRHRHQYAALPVRLTGEGATQVLLLTSRGTGRWVIPKGWPMRKLSPAETAAREAYEEAGVEGTIEGDAPIGYFLYDKAVDKGSKIKVQVDVFLFRVLRQLETWPEQAERETRWHDPEDAAHLVNEPELATLLRNLRSIVSAPK